jgi:hypothetical protein
MESVARLIIAAETPLAAQVGVATGLVVVGDLLSTGEAWEEAVVGDTPNRPQSRWRSPGSRTSYPVGSTSNPELCRAMISGPQVAVSLMELVRRRVIPDRAFKSML